MKKLLSILFTISILSSFSAGAQTDNRLFPYPEPPKDMTNLYERCTFIVYKFWEKCNIKSAFSSKAKLNAAFGDWLSFMPYASADTVFMAIDRFHDSFKKSGQQSFEVAKMAEAWLYSDSASYRSDELYKRFVDHAVVNKKIPAEERRHFEAQKLILDNSSIGSKIPDIELTKADGTKTSFYADTVTNTILIIYEPDCMDCSFARVRLSADMILNQLNRGGIIKIVSLFAGEPDAAFAEAVADYPVEWLNVASPEASKYFDMSSKPSIYYLDKDNVVVGKNLIVDNIIEAFRTLMK